MFMFNFLYFIFLIVPVLLNVAFVTLMERKILGYSQLRKGPNKVSFLGIIQPISDAVKLFMNENLYLSSSNFMVFFFSPMLSLLISMFLWLIMPLEENMFNYNYSWIFLLMIMSLSVYPLLMSGWSSNSKYSFLGAIRGVAQIISYEVVFTLVMFMFVTFSVSLNLIGMMEFNKIFKFFLVFPFIMMIWLLTCLAETNRTPFDFAEGESELVSGFNTEYMSGIFALIFMSEYMSILFLGMLTSSIMMKFSSYYFFYFFMTFLVFIWIWVRSTYPRHRYDLLMFLSWKSLMPLMLLTLSFFMMMLLSY